MVLIIDGNNLVAIATFAMARNAERLTLPDGSPVGGVYTSLKMVRHILMEYSPHDVVATWDWGKSVYRTERFPAYKEGRESKSEDAYQDLIAQLPVVQKLFGYLGFKNIRAKGIEADDIIYRSLRNLRNRKQHVVIVSTDKDLLQLVADDVIVFNPVSRKEIALENFEDMTGFLPEQYLLARAMMGDKSDNIPGIKGIGPKTARKILDAYPPKRFVADVLTRSPKPLEVNGVPRARLDEVVAKRAVIMRNLDLMDLRRAPWQPGAKVETWGGEFDKRSLLQLYERLHFKSVLDNFREFHGPFVQMDYDRRRR